MNIDELNNEINKFVENEIEYIQNCIIFIVTLNHN